MSEESEKRRECLNKLFRQKELIETCKKNRAQIAFFEKLLAMIVVEERNLSAEEILDGMKKHFKKAISVLRGGRG